MRFDPAHPWDYVVCADGMVAGGEIRSADGAYRAPVETNPRDAGKRGLTLRVSLTRAPPLLVSVLRGGPSWHYVLVGACDPGREGRFAAVRESANAHDGGGGRDASRRGSSTPGTPRLEPGSQLGSENAGAGMPALVEPVLVGASAPSTAKASVDAREGLAAEAEREAANEGDARSRSLAALAALDPRMTAAVSRSFCPRPGRSRPRGRSGAARGRSRRLRRASVPRGR